MTDLEFRAFNVEIKNKALDSKELPKRIKVLDWGKNETTDGPVFLTNESLSVFDSYQKKTGRDEDVALDFDHCTVPDAKEYVPGKPKSIAAYGDPELIKDDGLYLNNLEWTPLGEKNARNYKDLSPAVVTDKNGVVVGLHSAALTPNGAIYKLHFYSTKGFDTMIKKMSVGNEQEEDVKKLSEEGNLDNSNKIKNAAADEKVEHDENNPDCKCVDCLASKKLSADEKESVGEKTETKAMSAGINKASFPDAYKAQMPQYNTMNDTVIKQMAADIAKETGMENSDAERVLFAFLAKFEGELPEVKGQITTKANTEEGGLKQFAAKFASLEKEIETLKNDKSKEIERASDFERQTLIKNASKEGKIIPLSADEIKSVDVNILRSIVEKQPKNTVPMTSTLRVLSVDASKKPSRQAAVSAFESMVKSA